MKHRNLILAITLLAFALRVWQLDSVPPGWRDDELSNAFVVSQQVLDGEFAFFYPEASGHEGLYHLLQAGLLSFLGVMVWSIRGVSVFTGTLTIPLTYVVGSRLFNKQTGLLASVCLALSFWSLMYSRFGLRHTLMPVLMLAAFYWFLRGIRDDGLRITDYVGAGIAMGLGLHTYFAAWGVPLIIGGYCIVVALFGRERLRGKWQAIGMMFAIAILIAVPLVYDMLNLPPSEEAGRVSEVGKPLRAALAGDFSLVAEQAIRTVNMFHSDGDSEWLYNIPFRPIFAPLPAIIFWIGVLIALIRALCRDFAALFLLLWFLAGITPSILSVPAGSLGHTIAAQPAIYVLLALPLTVIHIPYTVNRTKGPPSATLRITHYALRITLLLLPVLIASRDLPDYFNDWATRGNVRFLYHADAKDVADYLHDQDLTDFGVTGLLAGQWERLALSVDAPAGARPRWFDERRAIFLAHAGEPARNFTGFPVVDPIYAELYADDVLGMAGGYELRIVESLEIQTDEVVMCWVNGLCLLSAEYHAPILDLTWHVATDLDLPPIPLYSFPPAPGTSATPRLAVFTHLWSADGAFITGDDGLWIDPVTLQTDDVFRQRHILIPPDDSVTTVAIGLYDPLTGVRIAATSGEDYFWTAFSTNFMLNSPKR